MAAFTFMLPHAVFFALRDGRIRKAAGGALAFDRLRIVLYNAVKVIACTAVIHRCAALPAPQREAFAAVITLNGLTKAAP